MVDAAPVRRSRRGPSRWSRRATPMAVALAGCGIATYLALYQLRFVSAIWEPFFGDGSRYILKESALARRLPVSDALLGAIVYLLEFLTGCLGGRERYRTWPLAVWANGAVAAALAMAAIVLVFLQAFWFHAFCTLCLASAACSLAIAALVAPEVWQTWRRYRRPIKSGAPSTNPKSGGYLMAKPKQRETVVVTGASAGVGRAVAQAFAKQGARIGLLARGNAGLDGARRDVEKLGGEAIAITTDVADAEQVEQAALAVEDAFGPIDIWVNDAFCSVFSPAKEMTAADYKRVTEVTYLGFVHGTLAALKRMLPRDKGMIVQVGSALSYRGIPLQSAYCAAKFAIRGFTDSVRCELLHDNSNVKITMVQMPALNTPQFTWSKSRMPRKAQPVPPIYQPEVAADAVVWASHHYRREWLVGGSTAVVVTANKFLPGLGDRYLAQNGYDSQMRDGHDDPDRPNNLFFPLDEERDYGAHGVFDDKAHTFSLQLWADQQRKWIALAGVAGAACDALRNGVSRCWRGGLLGLAAAAMGVFAISDRRMQSQD